ncbi:hypothetical protein NTE_02311 [Candidatus Nitrososphaera evergladensis SR1]|jgi:hypothetical protein|uniref:Uncharacterized protein n=1 Tax=Candidatus Nitrososphaera evergladensis SR1 TaxID=1459636 RepID=A0A075MYM5_9ARCH|nr:hypothetical protein [Candidatus Nitrososphaera evergladensis]AIF84364.1 hypothetical protein NTE_02311 [Candidatus Nitrososphaera evergladensis SR1]
MPKSSKADTIAAVLEAHMHSMRLMHDVIVENNKILKDISKKLDAVNDDLHALVRNLETKGI